jgi:hypothetical protein
MHIIDVRRRGAELSATMAQMRTWLDHHGIEPKLFELAFLPGRAIRFRVAFRCADEAASFGTVFGDETADYRDGADNLAA